MKMSPWWGWCLFLSIPSTQSNLLYLIVTWAHPLIYNGSCLSLLHPPLHRLAHPSIPLCNYRNVFPPFSVLVSLASSVWKWILPSSTKKGWLRRIFSSFAWSFDFRVNILQLKILIIQNTWQEVKNEMQRVFHKGLTLRLSVLNLLLENVDQFQSDYRLLRSCDWSLMCVTVSGTPSDL